MEAKGGPDMSYLHEETFSERLKRIRIEHGMTQQQVADELSIHRTTYTYYELGRSSPPREMLERLVKLFHIPYDTLLGSQLTPNPADIQFSLHSNGASAPSSYSALESANNEQKILAVFRSLDQIRQKQAIELLQKLADDIHGER